MHPTHLEDLLQYNSPDPAPRAFDSGGLAGAREFTVLTGVLVALIPRWSTDPTLRCSQSWCGSANPRFIHFWLNDTCNSQGNLKLLRSVPGVLCTAGRKLWFELKDILSSSSVPADRPLTIKASSN